MRTWAKSRGKLQGGHLLPSLAIYTIYTTEFYPSDKNNWKTSLGENLTRVENTLTSEKQALPRHYPSPLSQQVTRISALRTGEQKSLWQKHSGCLSYLLMYM